MLARNALFTTGATVTPAPANPFDPAQATVRVRLHPPRGGDVVADAYWFQDYTRALVDGREVLTERGAPYWKVRFTPTRRGVWWWRWEARTNVGRGHRPVAGARGAGAVCEPRLPARQPADPRYLAYDDGSPYFAVGENLAWYDRRGTYAYDDWLDELARQGVTWVRVWMPSWAMGIEWSDTGLGDYTNRLDRAWQLDHVMDAAAVRGIAVQLVVQNHGPFSTAFDSEWADNPYNAANGGPLATPAQFFTDPVAQSYFRRRLRYLVARYGADTNLEAWELWNEVDLTDGYNSSVSASWHRETANYVRSIDPDRHLVTTSFAVFANDATVWSQSGLDLTQIHFYSKVSGLTLFPDLAADALQWPAERVHDFDRPSLFGELGAAAEGAAGTLAADPEGIAVHDGLWAAPFGQAMGTGMSWWWDEVIARDPGRYYPMFGSIAHFLRDVAFDRAGLVARDASVTGGAGRAVRAHELAGPDQALLWVKDHDVRYDAPAPVTVADVRVSLADLTPGRWCLGVWDTWAGGFTSLGSVTAGPGATLGLGPFARDVAVWMRRCS